VGVKVKVGVKRKASQAVPQVAAKIEAKPQGTPSKRKPDSPKKGKKRKKDSTPTPKKKEGSVDEKEGKGKEEESSSSSDKDEKGDGDEGDLGYVSDEMLDSDLENEPRGEDDAAILAMRKQSKLHTGMSLGALLAMQHAKGEM